MHEQQKKHLMLDDRIALCACFDGRLGAFIRRSLEINECFPTKT